MNNKVLAKLEALETVAKGNSIIRLAFLRRNADGLYWLDSPVDIPGTFREDEISGLQRRFSIEVLVHLYRRDNQRGTQ